MSNKDIGRLFNEHARQYRRDKPPHLDNDIDRPDEEVFEFATGENENSNQVVNANPLHSFQCPFQLQRPSPIAIPNPPYQPSINEAQEWIQEYTANQAYAERNKDENDPEKMAEAAANLLGQLDLDGDEKLRSSNFVAYLMKLAGGRYMEMVRPSREHARLERADFAAWREQYEESIAPIVSEEERTTWDSILKDWQNYDANGLGYEGFAEREFLYSFVNLRDNPFFEAVDLQHTADRLRRDGNNSQAIMAYEALVQNDNQNALAWFHLGQLQVENEQDILAIAAFQQASTIDPSLSDAWIEMAGCLVNEQCRSDAINALINYLKSIGNNEITTPNRQLDPSLLLEECLRCYMDASRIDEANFNIYIALSILHCMSGDNTRGLADINNALRIIPINDSNAHMIATLQNRMGALHANDGNYASALRIYDRILTERPRMARAHYNRGVSLFNGADYSGAVRSFVFALQYQVMPSEQGSMRPEIAQGLYHVWDMLRLTCEMAGNDELVIAAKCRDISIFLSKQK